MKGWVIVLSREMERGRVAGIERVSGKSGGRGGLTGIEDSWLKLG